MRVMVLVKASKGSEAGELPSTQLMTEMGNFNEELVKAGIMLAGDGLKPSSKGVRVRFSGKDREVIDGPFAETKELVAGFWIWNVKSMDEAIQWVRRCPNPMMEDSDIEIRPFYEASDFGEAMTPLVKEQEERLVAQMCTAKAAPAGCRNVTPYLSVKEGMKALEFYKKAFGMMEQCKLVTPEGKLGHAQLTLGDSSIMLADECPEHGFKAPPAPGSSPVNIHLYVENVDAFFERAAAAGAKVRMPPADMFYGDRSGQLEDPFGHLWWVATHKEDLAPEELEKRAKAEFAKKK